MNPENNQPYNDPQQQNSEPAPLPHEAQQTQNLNKTSGYPAPGAVVSANTSQLRNPETIKKKKLVIIAACVGFVIVFLAFAVLLLTAKNTNIHPTLDNSKFSSYAVHDINGVDYTVNFYKNAIIDNQKTVTHLDANRDGKHSAVFLIKLSSETTCAKAKSINMKVNGEKVTICQRPDNIIYTGNIKVNNQLYQINLVSQTPVNIEDAKAILESIVFQ